MQPPRLHSHRWLGLGWAVLLMALVGLGGLVFLFPSPVQGASPEVPGELIVLLDASVTADQIPWQTLLPQAEVVEEPGLDALHAVLVKVPLGSEEEAQNILLNASGVRWVEPNYVVKPMVVPNDPLWGQQYGLTHIQAPQAWDVSTGSASVIVAVVDSGVDLTHPDLAGKLTQGYDFVEGDTVPNDRCGHGTHVAGIIGANTNNALGVAGVNWQVQLMPVKVLGGYCSGSVADVAAGIVWATQHGAKIINLSLGSYSASSLLENATFYAYQHGVAVFAAAGNYGTNAIVYPAVYPWVMAVGATDSLDQRASFSDTGPELDLMAPGVDILSTTPRDDFYYHDVLGTAFEYGQLSGTSMATAFASGAAALLASSPLFNSPDAIYQALTSTALDLNTPGRDDETGWGLVQLYDALLYTPHLTPTPTPQPPDFAYDMMDSVHCANLVSYHWLDATSTNATLALPIFGNDGYTTVPLPFPFTFGGATYNQVTVSANGYVTFTGYGGEHENFFIPGIAEPNNFIAAFWDNLTPSVKGLIFTKTFGTAPNRQWVVEWQNVALEGNPLSGLTFEIVLSEADQSITLQYAKLKGPAALGSSATVGLEYLDGRDGVQYSYNQPSLRTQFAIRFMPRPANAPSLVDQCVPAASPAPTPAAEGIRVTEAGGWWKIAPFCLTVPQGTLHTTSTLYAEPLAYAPVAPQSWIALGKYLRLTLSPPQARFSPPMYLCYAYTQADLAKAGGNPENFHFAYYDPTAYTWRLLPTVAEPEKGIVWASTTHFTTFGVFVVFPEDLPVTGAPQRFPLAPGGLLAMVGLMGLGWALTRRRRATKPPKA